MNATIEMKPNSKYVIQRDEKAIAADMIPIERTCNLLNALINLMAVTDYELTSEHEVQQAISKGATRYAREKIVAKADREAFKKVFGFVPDDNHLMQISDVPEAVKKAEAITDKLRDNVMLSDYHFDGREFVIKPQVKERIVDNRTRYAHDKQEAKLTTRLRELVTEINALRDDLIQYAPGIYSDEWTRVEMLFRWIPATKKYEADTKELVRIFDIKKQ